MSLEKLTKKELIERIKYADELLSSSDSSGQNDFLHSFKSRLSVTQYPVVFIGSLKLRRSVIPSGVCEPVPLYLDTSTHLETAVNATLLGITPDEYIRYLLLAFNECYKGIIKK